MKRKTSKSPKASKGFAAMTLFVALIFLVAIVGSFYAYQVNPNPTPIGHLDKFGSCTALETTLKEVQQKAQSYYALRGGMMMETMGATAPTAAGAKDVNNVPYSETNVQVAGVDEADIVKTDGQYIYTLTNANRYYYGNGGNSTLVIAKAYPSDEAAIVSETDLGNFYPQEMFIQDGKILIFGSTNMEFPLTEAQKQAVPGFAATDIMPPYYRYMQLATVRIYDATDHSNPSLVRSIDFEGSYLSSRKIGPYVYFIVNSYPQYQILEKSANAEDIIPLYRDRSGNELSNDTAFTKISSCGDVGYFEPMNPQNFITIASISMDNPEAEVTKETVMGSGQNIYASASNLYIAEANYPFWTPEEQVPQETTLIQKFSLDSGKISYVGHMEASGHILNQFSMDEYDNHFRIATTVGRLTRGFGGGIAGTTSNNVYVFGSDLSMTGKIENIAPGESIYSARFIGDRGYMVTFKKVDPFFVLDLSDTVNPKILGKLKIPGYSDYLHPYDENHIIGIGKEAIEAEGEGGQPANFAWYQGLKIAIFDVTDVANPKELQKVVIGDRGTDSYALHDHKAFLFDREKNLLVIPVLLAELTDQQKEEKNPQWPPYGEYTFQGAYVYDVSLDNGFVLKGRITHYDANDETFMKSGYYYFGDEYSVKRSLYIDNILYTISGKKIKLNSLSDLSELKELVFGSAMNS